jgi:hypothetical protein
MVSESARQDSCFDSTAVSTGQLFRQDSCFDSTAVSTGQLFGRTTVSTGQLLRVQLLTCLSLHEQSSLAFSHHVKDHSSLRVPSG